LPQTQRVASTGSGGRCDTLWPGAAATAATAATADAAPAGVAIKPIW